MAAMRERLSEWNLSSQVKIYCDTGSLLTCRQYPDSIKHGYPKQDGEPRDCFPKNYSLISEPQDQGTLAEILTPAKNASIFSEFPRRCVILPDGSSIHTLPLTNSEFLPKSALQLMPCRMLPW